VARSGTVRKEKNFQILRIFLTGMHPEIWSIINESITDKFGILFDSLKGGYTYEEALQWTKNKGQIINTGLSFPPGSYSLTFC